jgi:hypothetical protein
MLICSGIDQATSFPELILDKLLRWTSGISRGQTGNLSVKIGWVVKVLEMVSMGERGRGRKRAGNRASQVGESREGTVKLFFEFSVLTASLRVTPQHQHRLHKHLKPWLILLRVHSLRTSKQAGTQSFAVPLPHELQIRYVNGLAIPCYLTTSEPIPPSEPSKISTGYI